MRTKRKLWVGATVAAVVMGGVILARDGLASRSGVGDVPKLAVDLSKNRIAEALQARSDAQAAARPTWQGSRFEIGRELRELEEHDPEKVEQMALAELLSAMPFVPFDRYEFFRALDDMDYRLDGWRGSIVAVERSPGGVVVDLEVVPWLDSNGQSTTAVGGTIERYQVRVDGEVRYLGSRPGSLGGFLGVVTD